VFNENTQTEKFEPVILLTRFTLLVRIMKGKCMRYETCSICNTEKPVNEIFLIGDKLHCDKCILDNKERYEGISGVRLIDKTICANCSYDNGRNDLPLLSDLPLCQKCADLFLNKKFPLWVKLFALTILVAVIFGFIYNLKFFNAFISIKEANKNYGSGNYEDAYRYMEKASGMLPEDKSVGAIFSLYKGSYLLSQNKYEESIELFNNYKRVYSGDKEIDYLILAAESSAAFDKGDFDTFYDLQTELSGKSPENKMIRLGIASAASCLYIVKKDEKYKVEAMNIINEVMSSATDEEKKNADDYIDMIKYRMYSKEPVDRIDFNKKFPNGWKGDL
jgi:tetratricopeptide (TPR) repeat protein